MYCYNPRTNKLHLSNCRYVKNNGTNFKQYGTENDVNIDIGAKFAKKKEKELSVKQRNKFSI